MPDPHGTRRLFERLYGELRLVAEQYLRKERRGHTLQPTALVHEAFLRLQGADDGAAWASDQHFRVVAARAMRRVLVDWARGREALKRGGSWLRITFDESLTSTEDNSVELIALDQALRKLEKLDPVSGRIIELRFFAGLTEVEVADTLGISERKARLEWQWARSLLRHELAGGRDVLPMPPQPLRRHTTARRRVAGD